MDIFARITFPYDVLSGFFEKLADDCTRLVVYQHDASQTHVHFYAQNCSIKTDAMKTRIKKHLQVASMDKNKWSFKTASDTGCITYMSKGVLEPMFVKGFTREELVVCKDRWVERTPETSAPKKSTVTQYDMAMEVFEMIRAKCSHSDITEMLMNDCQLQPPKDYDEKSLYALCIKYAIRVCHKHRKGFDEFSIRKIISPAYTKFANGKVAFTEKMLSSFFRI